MHFAVSTTWGPTDPTRAMLPFIFAASAVQAGDRLPGGRRVALDQGAAKELVAVAAVHAGSLVEALRLGQAAVDQPRDR